MNKLNRQIELAKKSTRRLKSAAPYLFQEWQDLQRCKRNVHIAKENYKIAKQIWDNLGK